MRIGLTEENLRKSFKEFDLIKAKDKIKGGKADNMSCDDIAKKHGVSIDTIKKQIDAGEAHEMEHTDNRSLAREIARDHLFESPTYYTDLKKIEKGGKTGYYKDSSENRKKGRVGKKYSKDEEVDRPEKEQVYFDTYGEAIDHVHNVVSKKFKIDDDEWFVQMGSGGKPGRGKTKSGIIELRDKKTDKPTKGALSIQVYNMDKDRNSFELNWYIN